MSGKGDEGIFPVIVLQLCSASDFLGSSEDDPLVVSRRRLAQRFVHQFRGEWQLGQHLWGISQHAKSSLMASRESPPNDLVFQYHMRVLTTQVGVRRPGEGLSRVVGRLTALGDGNDLEICEIRYSVALKTTYELDLPIYSLVTMADSFVGVEDLGQLWDATMWASVNIRSAMRATGVATLAFRIRSLLPVWAAKWSNLLDFIDRSLSFAKASRSSTPQLRINRC